jgi:glycosyltransferase involved in cell wall biosynthesis
MLIVHVIIDLTPGGAELMLKRLIAFHRHSSTFRHHVISLRSKATVGPQIEALGVEVDTLGLHSALSLPAAAATLVRRLQTLRPDIVQCWMYHGDLLGGLAGRAAGVPNILWGVRSTHIQSGGGTSALTGLIRRACAALSGRLPTRIVYVAHAARAAHERLGYDPAKGLVIPNGYSLPNEAAGEAARARLRESLGLSSDTLLIGTAGRFNQIKDYPSFVAAGIELAARVPSVHFLLAGRGLEQSNVELRDWLKDSQHADRFHLLGEQKDLTTFLPGLDVFCLHSRSEGFPNVVAEAMACGVPCVVTDVGDAAFLVGSTGRVVSPGDARAIAMALEELIQAPASVRRDLGTRARQRIGECFSIEAVVGRYEELYRTLVSGPLGGGGSGGGASLSRREKLAAELTKLAAPRGAR